MLEKAKPSIYRVEDRWDLIIGGEFVNLEPVFPLDFIEVREFLLGQGLDLLEEELEVLATFVVLLRVELLGDSMVADSAPRGPLNGVGDRWSYTLVFTDFKHYFQ